MKKSLKFILVGASDVSRRGFKGLTPAPEMLSNKKDNITK